VAVALLLGLLGGIYFTAVLPAWHRYRANMDLIAAQREQLARLSAVAARLPAFRARMAALQRQRDSSPFLLAEHSDALAGAALQERVKRVVQAAGGKLLSSQVLKPSRGDPFTQVTLNVRLAVSNEALRNTLYALESEAPFVSLDRLLINRSRQRYQRRTALARRLRRVIAAPLNVNFRVRGYIAPAASGSDPGDG